MGGLDKRWTVQFVLSPKVEGEVEEEEWDLVEEFFRRIRDPQQEGKEENEAEGGMEMVHHAISFAFSLVRSDLPFFLFGLPISKMKVFHIIWHAELM